MISLGEIAFERLGLRTIGTLPDKGLHILLFHILLRNLLCLYLMYRSILPMSELTRYDEETNTRISTARIIPLDSVANCSGLEFCPIPTAEPPNEDVPMKLWRKLDEPLVAGNAYHDLIAVDHVPALFEIIGQVSRRDCYLTTLGNEKFSHSAPEGRTLISCYIESRPTNKSRIQWGRYHRALMKMIEYTGYPSINRKGLFLIDKETLLPRIEVYTSSHIGREVWGIFHARYQHTNQ